VSSDFKTWWADYASGWTPRWNHGHEQHAERIAAFVWEHRDYREAMLRGENASLRAEVAKSNAKRDAARRDLCMSEAIDRLHYAHPNEPISRCASIRIANEIAVASGWDCFAKEAKP
jgi:uncharacterized small protein (DUF1192 family)